MSGGPRDFEIKISVPVTQSVANIGQVGQSLDDIGKKGEEAGKKMAGGAEEAHVKHSQLRQMVKGLAGEFPELYHVAHLALHPITLVVAGLAGAWGLWTERIKRATEVLGGLQLPDTKALDPGHINGAAAAWGKYFDAIQKGIGSLDSVEKQTSNIIKSLDAAVARAAARRAAETGAHESQIDADVASGKISETEGSRRKLALGIFSAEAERKAGFDARQRKIDAKEQGAFDLEADAGTKAKEAAGIKIASKEDDERTLEELKDRMEEAKKHQKESRARRDQIIDWQGGDMPWQDVPGFAKEFYLNYGLKTTGTEAIGIEDRNIQQDQQIIEAYWSRKKRQGGRSKLQSTRDSLLDEAAKEGVQGQDIFYNQIPEEQDILNRDRATGHQVDLYNSLGAISKASSETSNKADDLKKAILQQITKTGTASDDNIQALREVTAFLTEQKAAIDQIKKQIANLRHGPG